MDRLTTYKTECNREMICRYEDCDICEEYCPISQEDNCSCLKEILEKLGQYEDAEEQGLILRLPCPIGSTVYCLVSAGTKIVEAKVLWIEKYFNDIFVFSLDGGHGDVSIKHLGKTWFLTKEAAEQALADMKGV